jgi:predicted DNA-binding ribbon-helix-helix protein
MLKAETGVSLGSPKTRYIKRNYKEVKLKKVFWSELRALADRLNMSVPELIQLLYRHYNTCNQAQGAGS